MVSLDGAFHHYGSLVRGDDGSDFKRIFPMRSEEFVPMIKRDWLSPRGLGRLISSDTYAVQNENGILFRQYMMEHYRVLAGTAFMLKDFPDSVAVSDSLMVRPGLYRRNFDSWDRSEAHDNYVAHCHAHVMAGSAVGPRAMVQWAQDHLYCFNNVAPERWDLRMCRQPGEVGFYYVCALMEPPKLCWAWTMAGLWNNAVHKGTPGQTHLAWLRLQTLDKVDARHLPGWRGARYREIHDLWWDGLNKNWGSLQNVTGRYFVPEHPVNLLVKEWETRVR